MFAGLSYEGTTQEKLPYYLDPSPYPLPTGARGHREVVLGFYAAWREAILPLQRAW